jgi:hypothetical protein
MVKSALVSMILLAASNPAFAAGASMDSTAALARARELRPFVSSGTPGPLWSAFDDSMRGAMGDSLKFAGMMASIHAQTGPITEVLAESMSRQGESWVYRARCRFERVPVPLAVIIGLEPDGRVSTLLVQEEKQRASTKLDYITRRYWSFRSTRRGSCTGVAGRSTRTTMPCRKPALRVTSSS